MSRVKRKRQAKTMLVTATVFVLVLFMAAGLSAQEPTALSGGKTEGGTIHPSPKDIREAVDIYVFLAWIWGMILFLIFILRHKIKEMDRLHEIRYFSQKGKEDR
jgi:hypothetical protein